MSEQVEQLHSEIIRLKSRILDTQDAVEQHKQISEEFRQALGQIATVLGFEGNNIQLNEIVEAVQKLIPAPVAAEE